MGVGDEILAAGMAQRLHERDPSRRVGIFDRFDRPRWHEIWEGNPAIAPPAAIRGREPVHRLRNASGCRPYIRYPFTTATGWRFNREFRARDYVARIYLTDAERARGAAALAKHGPFVLIEPWTKHGNFRWPLRRWADLVAACPDLTFVQHTHPLTDGVVKGARVEPPTSWRFTCGILSAASSYVRSESGLCHAAAALGVPNVAFFGGTMDPDVLGGYPLQVVIADRGPGSPCGSWEPCQHCAAAMRRVTVDEVVEALRLSLRLREAA